MRGRWWRWRWGLGLGLGLGLDLGPGGVRLRRGVGRWSRAWSCVVEGVVWEQRGGAVSQDWLGRVWVGLLPPAGRAARSGNL